MNTSLSTKYRPILWKQFYGNQKTVASLRSILGKKECPHTLLFVGPSGCGKTTLARIVSKKLKCSSFDFIENNAADFRGIDSVRDIIRQMSLAPMEGNCRVWLLDECHQLSKDAQHALLKALEDTPSHVYFLLATTDPSKLLPTIKTRCVQFEVKPLTEEEILSLLKEVCKKEKTDVPQEVLEQIGEDSFGSPRMALSILNKIIGLKKEEMLETAKLHAENQNESIELCRALIGKKSWKEIAKILSNLEQDPEQVRRAILGYAQAVLLKSGQERAYLIIEAMRQPLYDIGKPGLVAACYEAIQ